MRTNELEDQFTMPVDGDISSSDGSPHSQRSTVNPRRMRHTRGPSSYNPGYIICQRNPTSRPITWEKLGVAQSFRTYGSSSGPATA